MRPSTSAGPAPDGHFSRSRGSDSHLRQDPVTDPIFHRPPGRLAHRPVAPPLETDAFETNGSQQYRSQTSSNIMRPSSEQSSAIYDSYSQPTGPTLDHRHFSHPNRHPNPSPSTSHSTPDTPSFHDPGHRELGYERSLGMWYPQDLIHDAATDPPRAREWHHRESDKGTGDGLSNIPRIYVESQERSPSMPYPSHSLLTSSGYTPSPHGFSPAPGSPLTSGTSITHQDSPDAGLHPRSDHAFQRANDYSRYMRVNDTESTTSRNFNIDTMAPTFTFPSTGNSQTRPSRTTVPVPILRLDTTSLEPSGPRASPHTINLGGYPPQGLTSPFDVPSPNPTSASSNPSPHSSTSSNITSPSPGSSPMTFVPFQPGVNTQVVHVITEDKSITENALRDVFPPSSQCPPVSTSPQGQPARKWMCQWPNCGKSVRRQDRVAHALEHHGRKRFACSCGGSFARSQDKKRHLREQAICNQCPRSVGRNGYNGLCPTCSQENNNQDKNQGPGPSTFSS